MPISIDIRIRNCGVTHCRSRIVIPHVQARGQLAGLHKGLQRSDQAGRETVGPAQTVGENDSEKPGW